MDSNFRFSVVGEEEEEEEDLRGTGVDSSMCGQEGNGVLHLRFVDCVSDLLFDSRNYFVWHFIVACSSAQRHSKPNFNSWFSSLTRSKGKSAMRTADVPN